MNQEINKNKKNILIVDDTPANLRLLSTILTKNGYQVEALKGGQMAIDALKASRPDLILLDIMMPDIDGYEVCQKLKANPQTCEIPVIFLSALNETVDKVRAFEVGGVDYIGKPFNLQEVLIRVKNQLALHSAKAEIQLLNQELEKRVQDRTSELEATNAELKKEIARREQYQKQLLEKAFHDDLTKLPNRALFREKLARAMKLSQQKGNYSFAVLFLDCDRFKIINDSLGHTIGDKLLIEVANRLKSCLRPEDTIARLGGDEFTILIENSIASEDATKVAKRINSELSLPFYLEENEVFINASIGIVLNTQDYDTPETILRDADTAMYRAKAEGKGRFMVFEPHMHVSAQKTLEIETDLRRAIARQEFLVHYQPLICLHTGKLEGFEALVRWLHPSKGIIAPGDFIPVAEESGSIVPLGMWVLQQACYQLRTWQKQYLNSNLHISVNLSVKQFSQPNLIEQIDEILRKINLDSRCLTLEITESAIVDNAETATKILEALKSRQIKLSMDDFGTGYSSLSYLHNFPIDTLKIDRSFIGRVDNKGQNMEIVRAIATLANHLGMRTVAEGVETGKQLERVKAMGCNFAQGYLFSKPLESKSAGVFLEKFTKKSLFLPQKKIIRSPLLYS
ncbi:MAG: EAL domain-containing protein [Prochloraceae cyanobacterium]|nr:EAL domain-containing protein [Prochloraceae cyanobacterium]